MDIEPPDLEDYDGIETDDPDVNNILEELRSATKAFKEAQKSGARDAILDSLKRYKDVSNRLIPHIEKFLKSNFTKLDPISKNVIRQSLEKFSEFYDSITQLDKPNPIRGGDDLGGSSLRDAGRPMGPDGKNLLNRLKEMDPDKNGLGEDGAFSKFLKKIGAKSKDFIDLAKDYLKNSTHAKFKADLNSFRELYSSIKKYIEDGKTEDIPKATIDELDRLNNLLSDNINEIKWKKDEEIKNPGKAKAHSKLSFLIKFLVLLETLGTGIMAWWLIKQYCDNHSGCLEIAYMKGQSYTTNNKKYCEKGTLPSTYSEQTTYGPQLCFCSQYTKRSTVSLSENDNCQIVTDIDGNNFTPDNIAYGGIVCHPGSGDLSNIDPNGNESFNYYSFIIMTPFDGAVDLFNKTADITKNTLKDIINMIVHAVIILAIVGGVLLVLYIVYKVVANRKPTEAIKIETDSSKFGNILGNLNKFSRYNIKPVKFGNRFNF